MSITRLVYEEMVRRVAQNHARKPDQPAVQDEPVSDERALHRQIMAWCDSQWPRVKYRHSRCDKPTREEVGVEDFSIFLPGGKTLHCEVKSKNGKRTKEQQAWAMEMEKLGHTVHLVTSFDQFTQLAQEIS